MEGLICFLCKSKNISNQT